MLHLAPHIKTLSDKLKSDPSVKKLCFPPAGTKHPGMFMVEDQCITHPSIIIRGSLRRFAPQGLVFSEERRTFPHLQSLDCFPSRRSAANSVESFNRIETAMPAPPIPFLASVTFGVELALLKHS